MKLIPKVGPLLIPIVVLGGAAGTGLVVAAEPEAPKPNGDRAFAAAPASLVTAAPDPGADSGATAPRTSTAKVSSSGNAATSLRKKKKKKGKKGKQLSVKKAKKNARKVAQKAYRRDKGGRNWDNYGVSKCGKPSRKAVSCAVFLVEYDGGYEYDDYTCEWVVKSTLKKRKKVKVTDGWRGRVCG